MTIELWPASGHPTHGSPPDALPPGTTGRWEAGQLVIDADGVIWKCTAAGQPGSWQQLAGASDGVQSIEAGDNVNVDATDPAHPVVSASAPSAPMTLTLPVDARVVDVESASWSAGRTFAFASAAIDGLYYIDGFTDASGSNSPITYTKLFGAGGVHKTGHGNLDAFWASVTHDGDGEVGLFIGDATSKSGGNVFGGDLYVADDPAGSVAANLTGLQIQVVKKVAGTTKNQHGLLIVANGTQPPTDAIHISGSAGWLSSIIVRDSADSPIFEVSGGLAANSYAKAWGTLIAGDFSSMKLKGASDIGRIYGGGSAPGLLLYTGQGGTGTGGQFQVRDNDTDNNARLVIATGAPASNTTVMSFWVNDGAASNLRAVTVGVADSGGAGYRLLRVGNSG